MTTAWEGEFIAVGWLVFLAFPGIAVWRLGNVPGRWIGLVALAAFVPVYLRCFADLGVFLDARGRRHQAWRAAVILVIVAGLVWAIGIEAISMAPFLIGFTTYGLWPPFRLPATLAVAITCFGILVWSGLLLTYYTPALVTVLMAVMGMLTVGMIEHKVAAAEANQHLQASEQRERLARDVHDLVGHSITVANLRLQLAEHLFDTDPPQARTELARTREFLQEAHEELRRSVTGHQRRPLGDELQHVTEALRANGVHVNVEGDPATVTGPIAVTLGWVLREAATNVLRHANASRVRIQFGAHGFTLEDDGDGPGLGQGSGVPGMRQRVAASGGAFSFGSAANGGSAVKVTW